MSLGTLSNVNVDVTDIKMATGSWYCLSFTALIRQIRTAGVKTKALKFTAWDRSFPFISETSNFRLLFMTSRTSALSLLQLAIFDCEQSLSVSRVKAWQDWRERNCQEENWRERGPTPVFTRLAVFFSFASLDFLARAITLRDRSQSNVIKAF